MQQLVPGQRAFAAVGIDRRALNVVGVGVYRGKDVPAAEIPGPPRLWNRLGSPCGVLDLDDGTVVYECEAWFGSEEELAGYRQPIVPLPLDVLRARNAGTASMLVKEVPDGAYFKPGSYTPSGHNRGLGAPSTIFASLPSGGRLGEVPGRFEKRQLMCLDVRGRREVYLTRPELRELIQYLILIENQMGDPT